MGRKGQPPVGSNGNPILPINPRRYNTINRQIFSSLSKSSFFCCLLSSSTKIIHPEAMIVSNTSLVISYRSYPYKNAATKPAIAVRINIPASCIQHLTLLFSIRLFSAPAFCRIVFSCFKILIGFHYFLYQWMSDHIHTGHFAKGNSFNILKHSTCNIKT